MKILITGSNGLLGQKLIEYYQANTLNQLVATARGLDRFPHKTGYVYESLDITNQAAVLEIIAKHQPDAIINTAAMTNVDACEGDQAACDELNVKAVEYLVQACNQYKVHLVHVSTDFIFDGTHGPIDETEKPAPLSYYGHSKLKAEQYIMAHANSWAIPRTVLVYGIVSDMSRSNIVLWAKGALESGKEIKVVNDQFRTPTLAEDLAIGCALIAEQKAEGIFNISGSDFMSVFDLVYQVADFWNLDKNLLKMSSSEGIQQPAKRPAITGFIIEKAKNQLGYKPRSFKEGLAILDHQLNNK